MSQDSDLPRRRDADFPAEYRYADDEISLYDLWIVLLRRIWWIVGVGGLVAVLGGVYAFSQPAEYQFRSSVQLPKVQPAAGDRRGRVVVSAEALAARLSDSVIPDVREELFGEGQGPRVQVSASNDEMLIFTTRGLRGDERIAELHRSLVSWVEDHVEGLYKREITLQRRPYELRLEVIEEGLDVLESLHGSIMEQIRSAGDDAGVAHLVLVQEAGGLRRDMTRLRGEKIEAQARLERVSEGSDPTTVAYMLARSEDSAGTGKALILALSLVLGGMLGVFAAFLVEFHSNALRRMRQQKQEG